MIVVLIYGAHFNIRVLGDSKNQTAKAVLIKHNPEIGMLQNKESIRKHILDQRKFIPSRNSPNFLASIEGILKNQDYRNIATYYPLEGEVDVFDLILLSHYKWSLPVIKNNRLFFAPYSEGDSLHSGDFGIMIPNTELVTHPEILIIPGLAFDKEGSRIGFGQGHYDKYLNSNNVKVKIGVCFEYQLFDIVPSEELDVKMNYIVTEKRIIKVK